MADVRAFSRAARRAGRTVGLVPTMGALHAGHLALIRAMVRRTDAVAVSVFVNPTQFAPGEDLDRYPRDLDADRRLAEEAGAHVLFAPPVEEIYPVEPGVWVDPGEPGRILEGAARPTHFRGVLTVVTKLLNAVEPDWVAFGQKDAQQAVLVRRLIDDLLLPVRMWVGPTVRDPDGLALSSRNAYLDAAGRRAAPELYRSLLVGRQLLEAGERRAGEIAARVRARVAATGVLRPDYVAVVAASDLSPVDPVTGRVLLLAAAVLGGVRLIDNLCLEVRGDRVAPSEL